LAPAARGSYFDLFLSDFFVIFIMSVISIRVEVFIGFVFGLIVVSFIFFLSSFVFSFFGLEQCEFIFMRDLIIIRMNFAKGEKAVAVAAIFYEGGL